MNSSIPSRHHNLSLNPLLKEFQLQDVWRCQHASERDFTFFTPCHNSYSRIDLFLIDQWTKNIHLLHPLHNLVRSFSSEYYHHRLFSPLTHFPLEDEHSHSLGRPLQPQIEGPPATVLYYQERLSL